jgi:hypothetical protein
VQQAITAARYGERMSEPRRIIDLEVRLGGELLSSELERVES